MRLKKNTINTIITFAIIIAAYLIVQWMIGAGRISRRLQNGQLVPICVYIVMAISLNLVVGISGELSLGHAGFMCVGAYAGVIMAAWLEKGMGLENTSLRLLFSLIAGGVFAGVFGALIGIPVLRLRGDYLAIVTLAFGEIIRNLMTCLYVNIDGKKLQFMLDFSDESSDMVGNVIAGAQGAKNVTSISTFTAGFFLVLFAAFIVLNLIDSRSGRAIIATRDNRIAAEAMGINVTKYKMMAFVTSAALAGMAGALYGLKITPTPERFDFNKSIEVLVFVVLGGIGNIWGSVISAALLTVLPEVLRVFNKYRMLVYAIVLIVVMLATNNPLVRQMASKLIPRKKRAEAAAAGDDVQKGGAAQ